ncbi:MAG: MlaD family protein [Verrucomicrobiota bacterium]
MSEPASPKVSRRLTVPLVWIVPLIALGVGGWMLFHEYRERGPEITIDFAEGNGIEPRKTSLEYLGVSVGTVTAVKFAETMDRVRVTLRLERDAAPLARQGTLFWVVRPEIGLSGVRGLDTLFSGARIVASPGKGEPATAFQGLEKAPPLENREEGRAFTLQADRLGSMLPGAPVFFREMKVGVVETSRLSNDSASVMIRVRIKTPYVDLVRKNTRFWNAGGVSFKVSLLGAQVKSTSLESLFSGGISFATPDGERGLAPVADDGDIFTLHPEMDKEWLKWRPLIPIQPPNESPDIAEPRGPLAPLVK